MQLISQQQVPHHPPPANKPRPNAAAVPTISYQPTDIIIPTQLYDKIGKFREYKRLQEVEKVDLLIARKSLDFQAIQQKSIHPQRIQTIYRSFENFHLQYL